MPDFSHHAIGLFLSQREVTEQGGLLSGNDPTEFHSSDPIRLWIVQVGVIVCTACFLSLGLSKIRQPKVIAEVLGGILLGPTGFGRIPGFTQHIFPLASRSYLSLVANIGLVLFLFIVGLEIDSTIVKRNARLSFMVALAGMVLPFSIGAGIAHAVYREFIDQRVKFTHFMLFTGVAYSITAFPVLCRILTELKLLDTTVGVVVLSAGVGNDIVGWVLLALSVALVNAGTATTALYILLACLGWTLFLLLPVKMALFWLAQKTGSIESGPSLFFMTVTMMIVFGSAFITDIVGVHAIFGAFIAGLIVPREGGLAIKITEKLEDMVSIIFLPLYFTLSGLSTDLTLLDNGITWAYTIAIIITAFVGKFGGCTLAAHYCAGFNWRESSTIGSLMSCKGLVELIVLNVGLSAGILSQRVFSMFVLEALVLTFTTTPLVTWLYPPHLRQRMDAEGVFNHVPDDEAATPRKPEKPAEGEFRTRFTIVLDKLEHVPGMMALTQLIQPFPHDPSDHAKSGAEGQSTSLNEAAIPQIISAEVLRLIELSDRVSAVMKSSLSDYLHRTDPLISIFRMFGQLNGIHVSSSLSVVKFDDLAYRVSEHAKNHGSNMIFLPWLPPSHDGSVAEGQRAPTQQPILLLLPPGEPVPPTMKRPPSHNPFDLLFRPSNFKSPVVSSSGVSQGPGGGIDPVAITHSQFVRGVFAQSTTDVALFVDQSNSDSGTSIVYGAGRERGYQQHVFLPFFGGPDDRLALEFVVQICSNPRIRGTIVRITRADGADIGNTSGVPGPSGPPAFQPNDGLNVPKMAGELDSLTVGSRLTTDTVYGQPNTEIRVQSETADNIIWARFASTSGTNEEHGLSSSVAAPHLEFTTLSTAIPLHAAIELATKVASSPSVNLTVVAGRSRRLAVDGHNKNELKELMEEHRRVGAEVRKTVGAVATAFVVAGVGSGVVVVHAAGARNIT